jgi:hypothetical protein|nr:MAG TPA: hypothetical protein [Caudoviricetes sp.]
MYPNIKRKKTNGEKEKERTKYRAKPVIVHEQFIVNVQYSSLDIYESILIWTAQK